MGVLITLKSIRLNGEIVQPGTMITVADEQGLIDKGYARRLTKEETQAILSEYVIYADKIFNNKPQQASVSILIKHSSMNTGQGSLPL